MNLGRYGEDIACAYLEKKRYTVLKRNFYTRQGEVDIIATYQNILIFIEVKTRIGRSAGEPYEAITQRKLRTIRSVGYLYLHVTNTRYENLRIDVISLTLKDNLKVDALDHFENVDL